ncbi:NADPH-dependent 7-cyano-7-deazaguanine reductase QueF [Pseudohaliea rubra]|uniref:NADPH dependent preQ0 reductase n=1 Tax=Pseudohaliea rubra DSM 19751 TaxID=1265313 RepID=A0A095XUT5_9GAMM|nr:NADPH-dependent 7-cyano-7-deazaguanine reductase QueF [Pseudohaliea rubra]KGE03456.1 NADPH dependent preQ0 reductase [Pseudohaliea rubra DSM 19751]
MDRELPLGRQVSGSASYDPSLLFPLARSEGRARLGLGEGAPPFHGVDVWHGYELSWLEPDGRPRVALGRIEVPADSPWMVESKSLKLYLNAINGSTFASAGAVRDTIARDLTEATGGAVAVSLAHLDDPAFHGVAAPGECIDDAPFAGPVDAPARDLLRVESDERVEETLHSHLLRSLCPVTAQPDWATVIVSYRGSRLDRGALLAYLVAFREHQDFHEQCVERIFLDLAAVLSPETLAVQALYTRRGGLDISPWRSSGPGKAPQYRLHRQ